MTNANGQSECQGDESLPMIRDLVEVLNAEDPVLWPNLASLNLSTEVDITTVPGFASALAKREHTARRLERIRVLRCERSFEEIEAYRAHEMFAHVDEVVFEDDIQWIRPSWPSSARW